MASLLVSTEPVEEQGGSYPRPDPFAKMTPTRPW